MTAVNYLLFHKGIDSKVFGEKLLDTAMCSSRVSADDGIGTINMKKDGDDNGED